jgi:hypothetical protein
MSRDCVLTAFGSLPSPRLFPYGTQRRSSCRLQKPWFIAIYELSVLLSNYYCVRRAIDLPRQVRDKREGTSGTKDAVFAPSSLLNVFPTLSPEQKKENRNATLLSKSQSQCTRSGPKGLSFQLNHLVFLSTLATPLVPRVIIATNRNSEARCYPPPFWRLMIIG